MPPKQVVRSSREQIARSPRRWARPRLPLPMDAWSGFGPSLDRNLSEFLDDMKMRGLKNRILLVVCGEMGRTPHTPQVSASAGRDHHDLDGLFLLRSRYDHFRLGHEARHFADELLGVDGVGSSHADRHQLALQALEGDVAGEAEDVDRDEDEDEEDENHGR